MKEARMTNDSKSTPQGNKTDQDQDQLKDDQLEAASGGGIAAASVAVTNVPKNLTTVSDPKLPYSAW
jgi:hypothetical protein